MGRQWDWEGQACRFNRKVALVEHHISESLQHLQAHHVTGCAAEICLGETSPRWNTPAITICMRVFLKQLPPSQSPICPRLHPGLATVVERMDAKSDQLTEKGTNLVARRWIVDLQNFAKGDHAQGLLLQRNS